ncbi:MAG: endolytic transglycosylase MltG [Bacteroidota bacterium]|nr:endolytic transglycosylase MltG [Bacteroidota bacterium]MDP4230016.1 endolytic transglycosylase MltG [Bacteroidota bacterium]MDP4234825.1 endolytic transglycosylase MltG [Bacteroidota bacterium]
MSKFFKFAAFLAIFLLSIVYLVFFLKNPAKENAKEIFIIVPKGASAASVGDSLAKYDLIRSKLTFKFAARILGTGSRLQPGSYRIAYGLSNTDIITRLTGTEFSILFEATFPEGSHIRRIASIAKDKLGLDSALFVKVASDTAFIHSLGVPREAKTAEGYLFPDTYRFYLMMTPQELVKRMIARWKEVIPDSLLQRRKALNLSVHELMTLASVVEAEARLPEERDTIAGVYWNRLKIGMKLDADPTVQYGLGLSRPITHNDLFKENPYNTYLNVGLPPGPICNPGKPAIIAALNPAHHDKIYFVARGDGSGGHYFSHSEAEQERMIQRSNKNERE